MSDDKKEEKRIITRDNDLRVERPRPFSKMARGATKQDAVNAAVNAASGAYDQMAEEHDRVMTLFLNEQFIPLRDEFSEFRERVARRIRELERRSFSYVVLTALKTDWLRFQLWVIGLRHQAPATPELIDLTKLGGVPDTLVTVEADGEIHTEPVRQGVGATLEEIRAARETVDAPKKTEG